MTFNKLGHESMDEQRLADQFKKTGNLMDLTFDQDWLTETTEDDGLVGAGIMAQPYHNYLSSLTNEQNQSLRVQAQLLSILLPELKRWVASWGLGLSFELVHLAARRSLYRHLKRLAEEQEDWIAALINEDDQGLPMEKRVVRAQIPSILTQLLTVEDWRELAEVAAEGMSQIVLQIPQAASDKLPATV